MPGIVGAFIAATATGFLGSLHCVGMCGATAASIISRRTGLATDVNIHALHAIQLVTKPVAAGRHTALTPEKNTNVHAATSNSAASLAFNAGRIASYVIAGAMVAGIASALTARIIISDVMPLRLVLFFFGQCLVIATGLYIAGFTKTLAPFERLGQVFWRFMQRSFSPLIRVDQAHGMGNLIALGAVWGWIPCGMVYGTLATAMASGSAPGGALVMLGFGLGTMPAMFAVGTAAVPLRRLAQQPKARRAAGAIVIALGVVGLSRMVSLAEIATFGQLCSSAVSSTLFGTSP